MTRPDLSAFVAQERAFDDAHLAAHAAEAGRNRGVAWSGMGPDGWRPRPEALIEASARDRRKRLIEWRASARGRFLSAVALAQRAAEAAHLAGEAARAAVARGGDRSAGACRQAAEALEAEGRALFQAARAARRALGPEPGV